MERLGINLCLGLQCDRRTKQKYWRRNHVWSVLDHLVRDGWTAGLRKLSSRHGDLESWLERAYAIINLLSSQNNRPMSFEQSGSVRDISRRDYPYRDIAKGIMKGFILDINGTVSHWLGQYRMRYS